MNKELSVASRKLWEEVFKEDTKEFLDYYYRYVADHNRIYAESEAGEMVSMLHMNPYRVRAGQKTAAVCYIVAVATKEKFRHQGRMRRLLQKALKDSYQNREPFAFLMPAKEAIYRPFGFCTVRWQDVLTLGDAFCTPQEEHAVSCRYAEEGQTEELAAFSQKILSEHCAVFAERDAAYFKRIQKEQEAVNGGILLLYRDEKLCGYCFTGQEDGTEIWELTDAGRSGASEEEKAADYADALRAVTEKFSGQGPIKISGLLPGAQIKGISRKEIAYRPVTMVRIVSLAAFAELLTADEETEMLLEVRDSFLTENNGYFRLCINREGGSLKELSGQELAKEKRQPAAVTVEELTEIFFGLRRKESLPLEQVHMLHPVFFNELV